MALDMLRAETKHGMAADQQRDKISANRNSMAQLGQILISLGLTGLIGYLIYREVPDPGQSLRAMLQASPYWLLAALSFVTFHMLLRAARWGVLLRPSKRNTSYKNLLSLTLVKYAVNVIPPRTGEVAASIVLARKEGMSAATVLAASVFERILDAITLLAAFAFYLIFYGHQFEPASQRGQEIIIGIQGYAMKGMAAGAVGLGILALLLRRTHWTARIPLKLRRPVLQVLDGFRALQNQGTLFQTLVLSLAIWFSIFMQTWCLVQAYLRPFPLAGALLLLGLTVLGVAIPTPGGVGGYQYFMTLGLVNFFSRHLAQQDPHSQAVGISNGCYLANMIPVIIAGMIFLNKEGLSLSRAAIWNQRARGAAPLSDAVPETRPSSD